MFLTNTLKINIAYSISKYSCFFGIPLLRGEYTFRFRQPNQQRGADQVLEVLSFVNMIVFLQRLSGIDQQQDT